MAKSKMTEEEKKDWLELCQYFHDDLLEYSKELKFPSYLALRLKGLSDGKFIANNNTKPQGKYTYKTILYTAKVTKIKIRNCITTINVKDENHKINLIMKIIESEINDVALRLEKKAAMEKKTEKSDLSNQINDGAKYTTKSKVNENLKDLW